MSTTITLSSATFKALQGLATPFIDTPEDVIMRLIAAHGPKSTTPSPVPHNTAGHPSKRQPRERGIVVYLDGRAIEGASVSDLYKKVLIHIVGSHGPEKLLELLPLPTSSKRYLIATSPKHPNGNPFIVPVEHLGFYMEAHKSYASALQALNKLLKRLGIPFSYQL